MPSSRTAFGSCPSSTTGYTSVSRRGRPASQSSIRVRGMEPLRAAVIGVGYFGSRHADKLSRLPGVKLEYIVDTDRARAEGIAAKVGARSTAEFRDVLGKVDLAT